MQWKSILCTIVILWKHYGSITFIITFIQSSTIFELYNIMDTVLTNNPNQYSNISTTIHPLLLHMVPHHCLRHARSVLSFKKHNYHQFVNDAISLYVDARHKNDDVLPMNDVRQEEQVQEKEGGGYIHTIVLNNSRFLYQFLISGKYVANIPEAIHLEYVTFVHSFQKTISKHVIEIESTCKQVQLEFTYLYKLVTQYLSLCTYTFFFLVYAFQDTYIHSICQRKQTKISYITT
jgi:hypothetical protein